MKYFSKIRVLSCKHSHRPMRARVVSHLFYKLIYVQCGSYLTSLSLFVAPPDEKEVDGKIWIEFDDGDSGFFQLDEIKRIHPDFPVEGKRIVTQFTLFDDSQDSEKIEFSYQK